MNEPLGQEILQPIVNEESEFLYSSQVHRSGLGLYDFPDRPVLVQKWFCNLQRMVDPYLPIRIGDCGTVNTRVL